MGRLSLQIASCIAKNEFDLLRKRTRFEFGMIHLGIGGSHDHTIVPGNDEQHPTVIRVGHHDGGVTGSEGMIENEMDALRGFDHRYGCVIIHLSNRVGEDTGGVHHDACGDRATFPGFGVLQLDTSDVTVILRETDDLHPIDDDRAMVRGGSGQSDRHAGVIELTVVVHHTTFEPVEVDVRNGLDRGIATELTAASEIELAGKGVVEFQTDAIERTFPPLVAGDDEWQIAHHVRCVLVETTTLTQGFGHK